MNSKYLYILLAILLNSCASQKSFKVAHSSNAESLKETSGLYFLPQTRVNIEIEASKSKHINGPYKKYAQKYLGIDLSNESINEDWNISEIKVTTEEEIDPDQFYLIETKQMNELSNEILSFSNKGLLMQNPPYISSNNNNTVGENNNVVDLNINKVLIKKNLIEKRDTLYKTVLTDTAFVRIPVIKKQSIAKSIEKNAEEAAAFIIKLRKRRFKLISGQYENYQDKDALALSIEELNKLEEEYMSLFIGKTYTEREKVHISTVPKLDSIGRITSMASCFSKEKGLTSIFDDNDCETIMLTIEKDNDYTAIDSLNYETKKGFYENTLLYRIPGKARIDLTFKKDLLFTTPITVYQFGTIVPFSVE